MNDSAHNKRMGKHHKDSLLPTSSNGIELKGDPIYTIKFDKVKLSIWWSTKILELIRTFIAMAFITCFIWTLWNFRQDNENPNGKCPASSYQILGKQNTTIGCQLCSDCPPGLQLTPSCGSKIQQNALIVCTECPSKTYKDSQGRSICLPCQKCSPRQTISPCKAWKNARCGHCPRGTYPWDDRVNACKRCSTCCAPKRLAEMVCTYLGRCLRKNCTKEKDTKKKKLAASTRQRLSTPRRWTPSTFGPLQNVQSSNTSENPSILEFKMFKRTRVPRDIQESLHKVNVKYATKMATEQTSQPPNVSLTVVANTNYSKQHFGTASDDMNAMELKLQRAPSYFGINFTKLVIVLIVLVAILILALISAIVIIVCCCCCKRQSSWEVICCPKINLTSVEERKPLLGDKIYQNGLYQEVTINSHYSNSEGTFSKEYTPSDLEIVRLSDMSPHLEDILIKILEVQYHGQYCWKKVGKAVGISQDDLNYWENFISLESPATEQLLETLKARRPEFTVADLIRTLKSPEVQLPNVALHIHQHLQSARR